MSKPTIASVKAFIRKNKDALLIKVRMRFDGMTDCVEPTGAVAFEKAQLTTDFVENTLGVKGAWIVRGGRDSVVPYNDGQRVGYEVWNCCGTFILAAETTRPAA